MSDELKVIKEINDVFYGEESPVLIEGMLLCRNDLYGVNVLQIRFRNVSRGLIYELGIKVDAYDREGNIVEKGIEYNYYNMEVASPLVFGEDEEIVMEDSAYFFNVFVVRADMEGGELFRGELKLVKMAAEYPMSELGEFQTAFKKRVKEINVSQRLAGAAEDGPFYWRCTCGAIMSRTLDHCYRCHMDRDRLLGIMPVLREEKKQRDAYEAEQERLRQEEIARLALEEQNARIEAERLEQQRLDMEHVAEKKARQMAEEAILHEREAALRRKKRNRRQLIAALTVGGLALMTFLIVRLVFAPVEPEIQIVEVPVTEQVAEIPAETEIETETEAETETETETETQEYPYGKPVAVIGEDLTADDRKVVLRLIGMDEDSFQDYIVVTVTNKQEHKYLDEQIGAARVGNSSLSCLLITPTAPGSGIHIEMYNINYCTESMYKEATQKAGIEDADIVVAAPRMSSGTSALTGIYLAPKYINKEE